MKLVRKVGKIIFYVFIAAGILTAGLFVLSACWVINDIPEKVNIIICIGGNAPDRQEKVLEIYNMGYAQKLLLTNQSPNYFLKNGVSSSNIYVTDIPRNTFEEAKYCRWFMQEHKIDSALVVSDWWHLRRVKWSFETVFQGAGKKIKYISAQNLETKVGWWLEPHQLKLVLKETTKLVGYWVRF
ncbi:MAG: YdcF family protein [Deltaproteobacteria bacterium]|jgi:uncharacterized SAM-binding protein YcdF (DUF218 family)|nr:YdcF family protein [Deltaproteobacteria bacterium]